MNLFRAKQFCVLNLILFGLVSRGVSATGERFQTGIVAGRAGNFSEATEAFRASLAEQPASGTLINLGIAEWHRARVGEAILSWEQASWLDPFDKTARDNLIFARQATQLEAPEFAWYESASTLLPANVWAWISSVSLWLAAALMILPGVFRWRKMGWQHAGAATAIGVFLLSLPPNLGVVTRSDFGIVLGKKAALRLTPTKEGESVVSLVAGEPVRKIRERGEYVLIRTSHGVGWVARGQLGLMNRVLN